jgi:fatty acid desaturase
VGKTVRIDKDTGLEWPTLLLLVACYAVWAAATTLVSAWWLPAGIVLTALTVTLHSSLQHEALHGHPFRNPHVNHALVALPLGFVFPFGRFRDLHLAHHHDEILTDPYDDPESNFLDPFVWARTPAWQQYLFRANNTLLGRLVIGPGLGALRFWRDDAVAILTGDRAVRRDWLLHLAGMVPVVWWIWTAAIPGWAYAIAAYAGLSILKIRTYLEHRAHERPRGRSVVIERQGFLSFLFLNNSYHAVHHCKPTLAWYRLPAQFRQNRDEYLKRNEGYTYRSYAEVFRRHFLRAKDPVPHPLRPQP